MLSKLDMGIIIMGFYALYFLLIALLVVLVTIRRK